MDQPQWPRKRHALHFIQNPKRFEHRTNARMKRFARALRGRVIALQNNHPLAGLRRAQSRRDASNPRTDYDDIKGLDFVRHTQAPSDARLPRLHSGLNLPRPVHLMDHTISVSDKFHCHAGGGEAALMVACNAAAFPQSADNKAIGVA